MTREISSGNSCTMSRSGLKQPPVRLSALAQAAGEAGVYELMAETIEAARGPVWPSTRQALSVLDGR
ncbi:hypothetical protein OKW38_001966 [Paraburkholderia sp. MM5496-R1]